MIYASSTRFRYVAPHRSRTRSFLFSDAATTEIYTLSLHDALPIYCLRPLEHSASLRFVLRLRMSGNGRTVIHRSEEHTSELQSHSDLVCRLLLEKKNNGTDADRKSRRTRVLTPVRHYRRIPC